MRDKKGLSGIVMVIILIALVLVAAAIVWAIVSNLLENKSGEIEVASKCIGINIKATALDCGADGKCDVTLERTATSTSEAVDGVGLTFSNLTDSSPEILVSGDIAALNILKDQVGVANANKVDVRVYINNSEGESVFCSQINSYP